MRQNQPMESSSNFRRCMLVCNLLYTFDCIENHRSHSHTSWNIKSGRTRRVILVSILNPHCKADTTQTGTRCPRLAFNGGCGSSMRVNQVSVHIAQVESQRVRTYQLQACKEVPGWKTMLQNMIEIAQMKAIAGDAYYIPSMRVCDLACDEISIAYGDGTFESSSTKISKELRWGAIEREYRL